MREKYEQFLQFFAISEWDDAGLALDVFDGVSNDLRMVIYSQYA
jgi:hypothetical protein